MKISKSFKIYIHIIVLSLLSQNLVGAEDFSKNVIIHEKPQIISELRFKDSNLQDVDLINKRGKIMIINFWATWCAPCRKEMPSLEKLGTKLPEIDIFAVNMEKPNNIKVDKFLKDIGVKDLKTYYDPELRLVKGFKLRGLPTSILINKEGKEFGKVIGEIDFASDEFIKLLKKYVSENGKILPTRITNVSQKKQRELSLSIKRARNLALI